jgi:hypothetical protein
MTIVVAAVTVSFDLWWGKLDRYGPRSVRMVVWRVASELARAADIAGGE